MQLVTPLARPLLASMFVVGGLDAILNSEGKVKAAEFVTRPLSERFDFVPQDTETLVRVGGATQLLAGVSLALGKLTRLSSLALIASIISTTIAGHRFWEATSDEERAQQRVQFLKNAGLLGGLLLALAAGTTPRSRKPRKPGRGPSVALAARTTTRSHKLRKPRRPGGPLLALAAGTTSRARKLRKAASTKRKERAQHAKPGGGRRWRRILPAS